MNTEHFDLIPVPSLQLRPADTGRSEALLGDGWQKVGRKFWPGVQAAAYLSSYFAGGQGRKMGITERAVIPSCVKASARSTRVLEELAAVLAESREPEELPAFEHLRDVVAGALKPER